MINIEILDDKYEDYFMLKKDDFCYDYQELKLDKGTYTLDVVETYDNKKVIRLWRIKD